jgi:DNA adenine methylase
MTVSDVDALADHGQFLSSVKPFLRWAGGKSRIIKHLHKYIPREKYRQYWEPFLGAAALYFSLAPEKAHLSDSNSDLISCYEQIRDHPDLVFRCLRNHLSKTSERYYYSIRDAYNRSKPSAAQAARFIYLNKTSFNGIYRVNRDGQYNVPYGHKEPPALPSLEELRAVSRLLSGASLSVESYDVVLASELIMPGDLIYLDPPYPPLNEIAYFTHYTASRFSWNDQEKVAQLAKHLGDRGCFVMVSNANTESIRNLYKDWEMHTLPVVRWIAANGMCQ